MATEKQVYQFEIDAKRDKLRTSQRHRDGWRPVSTSHKNNQWEIIWNNDPPPPPPPKRRLTQIDFILELAEERNVQILGASPLELITIKDTRSWWKRNFG